MDNWKGAVKRASGAAAAYGVADRVSVCLAHFDADGALIPLTKAESASSNAAPRLPSGTFQLLLCVRFLERALFPRMRDWIAPGGYLLLSTFIKDTPLPAEVRLVRGWVLVRASAHSRAAQVEAQYPSGDEHVLRAGELAACFGTAQGFVVLRDEVAALADGRRVTAFLARKCEPFAQ